MRPAAVVAGSPRRVRPRADVSPAILAIALCSFYPKLADSLLAVASAETVFRVTNSRYHANPSSDRVFLAPPM